MNFHVVLNHIFMILFRSLGKKSGKDKTWNVNFKIHLTSHFQLDLLFLIDIQNLIIYQCVPPYSFWCIFPFYLLAVFNC